MSAPRPRSKDALGQSLLPRGHQLRDSSTGRGEEGPEVAAPLGQGDSGSKAMHLKALQAVR